MEVLNLKCKTCGINYENQVVLKNGIKNTQMCFIDGVYHFAILVEKLKKKKH